MLEKGAKKIFVAIASFIPHFCCDSVSGEDWFDREKWRETEENTVDGRVVAQTELQSCGPNLSQMTFKYHDASFWLLL